MDPEARCDELASAQHGVVSREQALAAGMTARAIYGRISSGRWRVALPGVYVPRPVPSSWHQRLMAAVLSGAPGAIVSHRSAAALWDLGGLGGRPPVEISVKSGRRIRGAIVHRRRPEDDPEVVVIAGFPVTAVERTLLDIARLLSRDRLAEALDDALRRRVTTLTDLEAYLGSLGRRGRVGSRALAGLVKARDDRDARLESPLESALLAVLRAHGLPLPTPQYLVREEGVPLARLDLAYPDLLLGIEADGYRWHGSPERWEADLRRENRLKLLGWTLLRFSPSDVRERPELVASQVRAAIRSRSLSQVP